MADSSPGSKAVGRGTGCPKRARPALWGRLRSNLKALPGNLLTPAVEAAPPKRVVIREGTVVVSRSIQAPTSYGLENRESRRIVNFLHSESEDINLKKFAGKKVIVTGEELIDQRWVNTPIIEVESIRLVP